MITSETLNAHFKIRAREVTLAEFLSEHEKGVDLLLADDNRLLNLTNETIKDKVQRAITNFKSQVSSSIKPLNTILPRLNLSTVSISIDDFTIFINEETDNILKGNYNNIIHWKNLL